jgi:hypothetical protein
VEIASSWEASTAAASTAKAPTWKACCYIFTLIQMDVLENYLLSNNHAKR